MKSIDNKPTQNTQNKEGVNWNPQKKKWAIPELYILDRDIEAKHLNSPLEASAIANGAPTPANYLVS